MLIDHVGLVFADNFGREFRVIGRIAFPVFVFLVAEGFSHTKSPAKFLARLFVFAVISEPFFDLAFGNEINFFARTNIFYTLFLGGLGICMIRAAKKIKNELLAMVLLLISIAFVTLLAEALTTDYGAYGVIFIIAMYLLKSNPIRIWVMAMLSVWQHQAIISNGISLGFGVYPLIEWLMIPVTLVAVVLVAFYNGKRGLGLKWLFYLAYPAHLAILFILTLLFV